MFPTEMSPLKKSHRFDLMACCRGSSGGAEAEWVWSGNKGENSFLYTSRLSYVPNLFTRNSADVVAWAASLLGSSLYAVDLEYHRLGVRKPETLAKKGRPPKEGSTLMEWAQRMAGKSGDAESCWSVSRYLNDDFATFATDIPSVASRLIARAGFDLFDVQVIEHGSNQYSFFCRIPASRLRSPVTLVRPN